MMLSLRQEKCQVPRDHGVGIGEETGNRVSGDMVSTKFKGQEWDLRDTERMERQTAQAVWTDSPERGAGLGVERDVGSRSVLVQL